MRKPLLDSLGRDRSGTERSALLAAAVKGWNTRDALAAMDPQYAPILDNWFPRAGQLELRGGSVTFASGVTGGVKALMTHQASGKFFAASDSGVFDWTAGGAVGAAVTPCTNGSWNSVNFTNAANNSFLWMSNGVDKPRTFDGAVWNLLDGSSTPPITGVTSTEIGFPWMFKHRIFFTLPGGSNSMSIGFLPLDSIGGAVQLLPQGNLFKKGGAITAGANWTLDAGDGPDDLMAIISSRGQLAVYKGTDPTSASNWALVGIWDVGRPLSNRCFTKLGGDLCITVESGTYPLSKLLQSGVINYNTALTNKIQPTVSATVQTVGFVNGWESIVYPPFDALITNVATQSSQWVMNTVTGALCSFSGWNATTFILKAGILYFGTPSGTIVRAWDGSLTSDDNVDVTATCHGAYTSFGDPTGIKHIKLFRPLLSYDGPVQLSYGISVDYTDAILTNLIFRQGTNPGTPWDTSSWDVSSWSPSLVRQKLWRTAGHYPGFALALWLQTACNNSKLYWSGTDYILGVGGPM